MAFEGSGAVYRKDGARSTRDAWLDLHGYVKRLLDERIENPQDDLLSELIEAQLAKLGEVDTTTLSTDASAVLAAGLHTTANQIANALLLLTDHPDQAAKVWGDHSMIPGMIEEAMRFEGVVHWQARIAKEDTEVAGVPIPQGAKLLVLLASGNRDGSIFEDPDRFD